jgi:oligosaccharyl transferase complex subunit OST4
MISDTELYRLAIVLGSAAAMLILLYHFLEVNADKTKSDAVNEKAARKSGPQSTPAAAKAK